MLDAKFVVANVETIEKNCRNRNVSADEVDVWGTKSDGMMLSDWIDDLGEWTRDVLIPRGGAGA